MNAEVTGLETKNKFFKKITSSKHTFMLLNLYVFHVLL